jgi:hypothetical protein
MIKLIVKRKIKIKIEILENILFQIINYEEKNTLTINEILYKKLIEKKISILNECIEKLKNKISLSELIKIIKKLSKKELNEITNFIQNLELKLEKRKLFNSKIILEF